MVATVIPRMEFQLVKHNLWHGDELILRNRTQRFDAKHLELATSDGPQQQRFRGQIVSFQSVECAWLHVVLPAEPLEMPSLIVSQSGGLRGIVRSPKIPLWDEATNEGNSSSTKSRGQTS